VSDDPLEATPTFHWRRDPIRNQIDGSSLTPSGERWPPTSKERAAWLRIFVDQVHCGKPISEDLMMYVAGGVHAFLNGKNAIWPLPQARPTTLTYGRLRSALVDEEFLSVITEGDSDEREVWNLTGRTDEIALRIAKRLKHRDLRKVIDRLADVFPEFSLRLADEIKTAGLREDDDRV
jgi:hypothetical protein